MKLRLGWVLFLTAFLPFFAQEQITAGIQSLKGKNEVQILGFNEEKIPISLAVHLDVKNLSIPENFNGIVVLPAGASAYPVAVLRAVSPNQGYTYSMKYTVIPGDVSIAESPKSHTYQLPFGKGRSVRVDQGYYSRRTHTGVAALDFHMRVGEPVFAAREGVVFHAVSHYDRACPRPECSGFSNYIMIYHPDGTLAEYQHLKKNGVVVAPGDRVSEGQLIGYSGNTGYSTGPHLHFGVFRHDREGNRQYIETPFKTQNAKSEFLTEGKYYQRTD